MLVAFDTSVLIAGVLAHHPFHTRAWPWLEAVDQGALEGSLCVHALAETYSVLTKVAGGLTPLDAAALVCRLPTVFRVNPAGTALYTDALARCAAHGLKSGVVFDALHLLDSEQVGAEAFLTFNASDFLRLSNGPSPKIVVPPDPPSLLLPR